MLSKDDQLGRVEKEPKTRPEESKPERPGGRKRRPAGIISADVEKHYEPGRVIGDGNFAVVKECRHRETRQAYAMKIIDKSKLKGKEDMVDSEIFIIQSLSHPNIVKLHEVYETETEIYLIMEYVQGGDLFDAIIESVKFPEHDAALMLMDLCKALVHMHDKSIVHRDLKPENLLVSPDLAAVGEGVYKMRDTRNYLILRHSYSLEYYLYAIVTYSFQYLQLWL